MRKRKSNLIIFSVLYFYIFIVSYSYSQININFKFLDFDTKKELSGVEVYYLNKENQRVKAGTSDDLGNISIALQANLYKSGDNFEFYAHKAPNYFEDVRPFSLTLSLNPEKNNQVYYLKKDVIYANIKIRDSTNFQPIEGISISYFKKDNFPGPTFKTDDNGVAKIEIYTLKPGNDIRLVLSPPPGSNYMVKEIVKTIRTVLQENNFSLFLLTRQDAIKYSKVNQLDLSTALNALDRATKAKDGSKQGQGEAIEYLLSKNYEFNGADFSGVNFSGTNLSNGNFTKANFKAAVLNSCQCQGIKMEGSNLAFAKLEYADLKAAALQNCYAPLIWGKSGDFEGANLSGSNFFSADLRNSNFKNADLRGTSFAFADLRGAKFDGADLTGAYFPGAILDSATFVGALIKNTEFVGAVSNVFSLTNQQKQGACRHLVDDSECLQWDVELNEVFPSNRFSSGLEFNDLVDTRNYVKNKCLFSFNDKSLPVCRSPIEGPPGHNAIFPGHENITLDRFLLSKANRYKNFEKRIEDHLYLLQDKLTLDRSLKGDNSQIKIWLDNLKKAAKEITPISKPYFSSDLIAVILTSKRLFQKHINWDIATTSKAVFDQKIMDDFSSNFGSYSMWKGIFPPIADNSKAFWEELPAEKVEIYKKWTYDRVKYAPNELIIKTPLTAFSEWRNANFSELNTILSLNYFEDINYFSIGQEDGFSNNGINKRQTRPIPVEVGIEMYYVFPTEIQNYDMSLSNFNFPEDATLELKVKIDRIVPMRFEKKKEVVLFFVRPIELLIIQNNKTIQRQTFNGFETDFQKQEKDFNSWETGKKINTLRAYEQYSLDFPKGIFYDEAQIKIDSLKEIADWNNAKDEGTRDSYIQFLSKYRRNSIYSPKADSIIEKNKGKTKWFYDHLSIQPTVKDKDGNIYPVQKMPDGRFWLASNLNVKVDGALCLENKIYNCEYHGHFYAWDAAIKACKSLGTEWRVPTKEEWIKLLSFYGRDKIDGSNLVSDYPGFGITTEGSIRSNGYSSLLHGGAGLYWTNSAIDKLKTFAIRLSVQGYFHYTEVEELNEALLSCRCIKEN